MILLVLGTTKLLTIKQGLVMLEITGILVIHTLIADW